MNKAMTSWSQNNVIYLQTVRDRKILEVHVDKGMVDGQKITFGGEGDQEPGLEPGDIIIVLDEKEHDVYKWVLCICSNAEQEEKRKCSSRVLEQIFRFSSIVCYTEGVLPSTLHILGLQLKFVVVTLSCCRC